MLNKRVATNIEAIKTLKVRGHSNLETKITGGKKHKRKDKPRCDDPFTCHQSRQRHVRECLTG